MQVTRAIPNLVKKLLGIKMKPSAREDYVDIGPKFVAKSVIVYIILGALLLFALIYFIIWPWVQSRWLVAKFYVNDAQVETYTGRVNLFYDADKTILYYDGRLEEGQKQGSGKEYYENGVAAYAGKFKDGKYTETGVEQNQQGIITYSGGYDAGLYSGQGQKYYEDGRLQYEGAFTNGAPDVSGKFYDTDGDPIYDGALSGGVYNGNGILYDGDGDVLYEGGFKDGLYDGSGIAYNKTAKTMEGEFTAGVLNGTGKLYQDGALYYSGGFEMGRFKGKGTIYYPNELPQMECAGFDAGLAQGMTTTYFANGVTEYVGQYKDGKRDGEGTLYDMSGENYVYIGGFTADVYNGAGTVYSDMGKKLYTGAISMGVYNGEGTLYDDNGDLLYEGGFADGIYSGQGKLVLEKGVWIEGNFEAGQCAGVCKYYVDSTLYYEGAFVDGLFEGPGKLYNANGAVVFSGDFAGGFINPSTLIGLTIDELRTDVFVDAKTTENENSLGFTVSNDELNIAAFCNYFLDSETIVVHRIFLYGDMLYCPLTGQKITWPAGRKSIDLGTETPMDIPGVAQTQHGRRSYRRAIYDDFTVRLWYDGDEDFDLIEWRSYRPLPNSTGASSPQSDTTSSGDTSDVFSDIMDQLGIQDGD